MLFDKLGKIFRAAIDDDEKVRLAQEEIETQGNVLVGQMLKRRPRLDPAKMQWFSEEQVVDLGKAHSNTRIWNRGGRGLFITKMDGTPTSTLIRFNNIAGSTYEVRPGYIKGAFQKIYLTNAAEAGKTLKFVVGYKNFAEFMMCASTVKIENVASTIINPATLESIQDLPQKITAFEMLIGVIGTANFEYSQILPDHTKFLELYFREGADQEVRIAFVTGKVADPVEPYRTLKHEIPYRLENLDLVDTSLYWAGSATGIDLEILLGA